MTSPLIGPSTAEIKAAWKEIAHADLGSFEDAQHIYKCMLITKAIALTRFRERESKPTQHPWGTLRVPSTPPILDNKRAAAGERIDD